MKEILIIKLGAKGDVIRTLPLIKAIKHKFPGHKVNLLTRANISDLLEGLDYIDKVFTVPFSSEEEFDKLYNFDIEDEATFLAEKIDATEKYGFYKNDGFVMAFNLGAEYYLNTLFDDSLKRSNKKTYQEMMFSAAELDYNKEFAGINLSTADLDYARDFLERQDVHGEVIIGIHIGASPRWPSKSWHEDNLVEFIKKLDIMGRRVILFAGPDEEEKRRSLINKLRNEKLKVILNNPQNTNREFASLINECAAVVCSDSFALHLALSLSKPTIGLFFCTSPNEVEGYNLLDKLIAPKIYEFFPERMDEYSEKLTKSIKAKDVLIKLEKVIGKDGKP